MIIIIIDESGDLGFDFSKKKTTSHFVITLLKITGRADADLIRRAVRRTIKAKVHGKKRRKKSGTSELKGAKTSFAVKKYFWKQVCAVPFSIYAIILNKRRVNADLRAVPDRLYNYLARFVIDHLKLDGVTELTLIVDKSKSRSEIDDFNNYLALHLKAVVEPRAKLDFDHSLSHEEKAIQAVDLLAWGIFRKYERQDTRWYNLFKRKIAFETLYLR